MALAKLHDTKGEQIGESRIDSGIWPKLIVVNGWEAITGPRYFMLRPTNDGFGLYDELPDSMVEHSHVMKAEPELKIGPPKIKPPKF